MRNEFPPANATRRPGRLLVLVGAALLLVVAAPAASALPGAPLSSGDGGSVIPCGAGGCHAGNPCQVSPYPPEIYC